MARPIVTQEDVKAAQGAGSLHVSPDALITEAARELAKRVGVDIQLEALHASLPLGGASAPVPPPPSDDRCLVTSVGRNRPLILAEITRRIGELGGNINDLSQRIVGGYFSTIIIVDLEAVESFGAFKAEMEGLSREGDYKVVVQHERIFKAMHRI